MARSSIAEIIIFVTNRCNLRCSFCCNGDVGQPGPEISLGQYRSLAQTLKAPLKRLIISGGEPSLREDLADIVAAFYESNGVRKIDIPFNGLFSDATLRAVSEILQRCPQAELTVDISLDGFESVHNALRGHPGSFAATVKTLDSLLALKTRGPKAFRVFLNTVVGRPNLDSLADFSAWVKERFPGLDYHSLILVRENNTLGQRRPLGLTRGELKQARRLILRNNAFYFRRRSWLYRGFQLLLTWMWTDMALRTAAIGRSYFRCLAYRLNRVIYPDGRISVCEMLPAFANLKDHHWNLGQLEAACRTFEKPLDCSCMHACFFCSSVRYYPWNMVLYLLDAGRNLGRELVRKKAAAE